MAIFVDIKKKNKEACIAEVSQETLSQKFISATIFGRRQKHLMTFFATLDDVSSAVIDIGHEEIRAGKLSFDPALA